VVLGQPDFSSISTNNGGLSGSSLSNPQAAFIVGTKLFVSDAGDSQRRAADEGYTEFTEGMGLGKISGLRWTLILH